MAVPSTPPPTAGRPPRKRRGREKSRLARWLHANGEPWGEEPDDFDPRAVERVRSWVGLLFGPRRYFDVEVSGWQRVPAAPAMIVSNHSGGTLILDSWGLLWAWYTHFGTARPIHPAAHELLMGNGFTGPFLSRRGVVRADRRVAAHVLEKWREDLLVMPGGDLDVWRPYSRRYEVEFAGHTGYARTALRAGVPVVPVANAGAHETLVVLSDGRRLARLLQLPLLVRAHVWPVHLSLPWGIGVGPWPHFPVPTKLRYRFGEPIYPSAVDAMPGANPTRKQVRAFDALARAAVQRQLNRLRDER